jgi:hypothetical protein
MRNRQNNTKIDRDRNSQTSGQSSSSEQSASQRNSSRNGGLLGGGSRGIRESAGGGNVQRSTGDNSRINRSGGSQIADVLLNHRKNNRIPARSGNSSYGTQNNEVARGQTTRPSRVVTIPRRVDQGARRSNRVVEHYRRGYHHYSPFWTDNHWFYPHYYYTYDPYRCAPSPFYFYGHMPAYVNIGRVTFIYNPIRIYARCNTVYYWRRPENNYTRYSSLDYAVDNIVEAFEDGDMRDIERMIPSNGRTEVELEDHTGYQMENEDFYDMMRDLVEGTDTVRYRIEDVRTARGEAIIVAEHSYYDAWGEPETVQHTIGLQSSYGGYKIVWFQIDR